MFESDGNAVGEVAGVFTTAEGARGVGVREGEDRVEDAIVDDAAELSGGVPGGVEGGHHAAHGGPGDDIDGDVVLFKPLQDADLGETDGSSAAEGEADAGPGEGAGRWGCGIEGGERGLATGGRLGVAGLGGCRPAGASLCLDVWRGDWKLGGGTGRGLSREDGRQRVRERHAQEQENRDAREESRVSGGRGHSARVQKTRGVWE